MTVQSVRSGGKYTNLDFDVVYRTICLPWNFCFTYRIILCFYAILVQRLDSVLLLETTISLQLQQGCLQAFSIKLIPDNILFYA